MAKQPGRKSKAALAVVPITGERSLLSAPSDLPLEAQRLWSAIVGERSDGFFGSGDLPLLRAYVLTTAVLIPKAEGELTESFESKPLDKFDKLTRLAESLAIKLRICVSSRTRSDTAAMRDSMVSRVRDWSRVVK